MRRSQSLSWSATVGGWVKTEWNGGNGPSGHQPEKKKKLLEGGKPDKPCAWLAFMAQEVTG